MPMTVEEAEPAVKDEPFSLQGKVALVTGGSRGLGRAMVTAFARAGADVIIASRKADACQALAREISESTGRRALGIGCHVGKWDQLAELTNRAYDEFGQVDVLVNNAGVSVPYDSLESITEELYQKTLDVNLMSVFRLSTLIGRRMADGSGGSIVNISTIGAVHPTPLALPYCAAKAGVVTLTQGLARAYGPKVRVNCIMAGRFRTDISKAWDMEVVLKEVKAFALERLGEPEDVVGPALFYASDASAYVTATSLRVDGGEIYP
jgi:NAD(P)-dependent dehydrogenase (short-subunit alcohol dehydrogenase family)